MDSLLHGRWLIYDEAAGAEQMPMRAKALLAAIK